MKTLKIRYYKDIFMKNTSIDVRDSKCFQELNKSYRFAKNGLGITNVHDDSESINF
ncbi:MAG: hypothetical protein WB474_02305 [Nitrososphaeraceae archaeon]